jgi:ADP-ribose pyrophosphatase
LPLLASVLGRAPQAMPARLSEHRIVWAEGQDFPMILPAPGAVAEGMLVEGIDKDDRTRLDFYEGGFAYAPVEMAVHTDAGSVAAMVYVAQAGRWQPAEDWRLEDWASRFGAAVTAAAGDVMALYGVKEAGAVAARRWPMLVRGASRARASAEVAPATLRRTCLPGDVQISARREPYANFFSVEEYDLAFRRFGGGMSDTVTRAAFVSGDAVTLLPYDPQRDRVLLVEQFRAGPFARGDREPWQLEPIAGRVDPGETPEAAGRREALEEAGLAVGALLPVAGYYPSPGAKTEYLYSFVALADLPDGAAGMGGLEEEGEDIRGHVIPFAQMMALVASGEIANAPLILTALWLERERPALRAAAGA